MRVLHVTPTYAPSVGGIENVIANLAQRVRAVGIEAEVAHVAPRLVSAVERIDDVLVHRVPLIGHRLIGVAPGLGKLARSFDLLHVHDPQVAAITMNLIVAARRVPMILSTHGGFDHTRQAAWAKRLHERMTLPLLLRHYDRVLASSTSDHDFFGRHASHARLVENGVTVDRFESDTASTKRDLAGWIYWGRFSQNKRLDRLIALVGQLRRAGIAVHLLIAGNDFDGLLPSLQAQVSEGQLEESIRICTGLSDAELRREVAARGTFVTASEYEGFGLAVIEAMGAGLVPICRAIAPLNRFVDQGVNGMFLRFDGGAQDVAVVRELLGRDPETLAAAARRRALVFDWSHRISEFVAEYRAVLSDPV